MSSAALVALIAAAVACRPQEAPPPPPPVTTAAAAVSTAWFRDVTAESGLAFEHRSGLDGSFFMPQNIGSGGALFDYDGDGDLDLYLVDSGVYGKASPQHVDELWRQEADGRFVDRTAQAGLGDDGYGMGCAVGDADNDGDLDLYVTNYGPDTFYRNDGRGRFTEATAAAGLDGDAWSTSACFFDYDADGALDLYVATYVAYDSPRACTDQAGRPEYCGPAAFRGVPDLLYRGRGDGTFAAASPVGSGSAPLNKGLGVACVDLDGDGRDDVYVANDGEPNTLWINRGDGTFEDRGLLLGAASNALGQPEASMGIALGDLDGDLDLDLFLTHLNRETNTLYLHDGSQGGGFRDATSLWDVGRESLSYTGFGTAFFDAENDGDLDLVLVNGRVRRGDPVEASDVAADLPEVWRQYSEPNLFYLNDGGQRLQSRADLAGQLVSRVEVSRSLLAGDLDRDGDVDLVVTHSNGPARIFRNVAPDLGQWLGITAVDGDRDALGARIGVDAGGRRWSGVVTSTFSYLASVQPSWHAGLGDAERVERLSVHWPGGTRQRYERLPAGRHLVLFRRPDR